MRNALETQMGQSLRDENTFLLLLPAGYRGVMNVYNTGGNMSSASGLQRTTRTRAPSTLTALKLLSAVKTLAT